MNCQIPEAFIGDSACGSNADSIMGNKRDFHRHAAAFDFFDDDRTDKGGYVRRCARSGWYCG
jgi:hypothetical protein